MSDARLLERTAEACNYQILQGKGGALKDSWAWFVWI